MLLSEGDNYNVKCPHCGETNHYPFTTIPFERKIFIVTKECEHCKKLICYAGEWVIKVIAGCENE